MTSPDAIPETTIPPEPIVARAGAYYRNMRYLMCVVLIGLGCWFAYDGFVNWPRENDRILALQDQRNQADRAHNRTQSEQLLIALNKIHEGKLHTDWDLGLQKMLGIVLPPLGVLVVLWALYNSRGEYRLENKTLSVPGHPPVALDQITDVDRRLWDRKGIVYVSYSSVDGKKGKIRLDDFVYERTGTDAIYDQLPSASDAVEASPGREDTI